MMEVWQVTREFVLGDREWQNYPVHTNKRREKGEFPMIR